jgi:hypothetical protein
MEKIRVSKGHSHAKEHRGRYKLGYEKNITKLGPLTPYRAQIRGQVITERILASKQHPLATECR